MNLQAMLVVALTTLVTTIPGGAADDESDYATPSVSGHPCYIVVVGAILNPAEVWFETNGTPGLQRDQDTQATSAAATESCAVRDVLHLRPVTDGHVPAMPEIPI